MNLHGDISYVLTNAIFQKLEEIKTNQFSVSPKLSRLVYKIMTLKGNVKIILFSPFILQIRKLIPI